MAEWFHYKEVEIDRVFKEIGNLSNIYLLKLRIPNKQSILSDIHEIYIQDTNFFEELIELSNDDKERCYFAYGLQDIDFYKVKSKYGITHSPHEGMNLQFILKNGEFEKLLNGNLSFL